MGLRIAVDGKVPGPSAASPLPRPRLFRLLDRRRPLLWVSAPPGAGKTTLVASYVAARRVPALWCELDAGDGDIGGFVSHMAAVIRRAAPRNRRSLPLMRPEYWPALSAFARRYFRELYRWLPPGGLVVLDNYQAVPEASRLHELIRDGIDDLPPGPRMVVLSRSDPPGDLAPLRARGKLAVLGWPELRLTPGESARLARLRRRPLSREAVRRLHARVDGWAMGFLLVLDRAAGGAPDGHPTSPPVFEDFAAAAFAEQSPAAQRFLVESALLPRMTARQAEALTALDSAERVLRSLAARHYVAEHRGHGEPVFQYHALFREFLLARAPTVLAPARLRAAKGRAAALLAREGDAGGAAALLRDAEDWDALGALVVQEAPALVAQGRSQTLEEWAGWLPSGMIESSPWLLYWLGTARTPFTPAVARAQLERAFRLFDARGDAAGCFNAWAAAVGTILYEWEHFADLDPWLDRLEALERRWPELPPGPVRARVVSTRFYALMFRRPQHPGLEALAEQALHFSRTADVNRRMMSGFLVSTYHLWRGEPAKAAVALELLREAVRAPGASPLERLASHAMEAYCRWHMAELDECRRAVAEGLALARATGVQVLDAQLLAQGASCELVAGDVPAARGFLRQMAAVVERGQGLHTSHYHFLAGWAAWLDGDNALAAEHLDRALRLAQTAGTPFPEVWNHIGLAHVLHDAGRPAEAGAHLAAARARGRALGSVLAGHMCRLADARFALHAGDGAGAAAALSEALAAGRSRGLVAFPWWHRGMMATLCARALEAGIEVAHVRRLVQRHRLLPDPPPLGADAWPWAVTVRALGGFQMQRDGAAPTSGGKVPQRPLELLKALIAHGGRDVPVARLADALWPEASGDAAAQALTITLHRLRALLGDEEALRLQAQRLSLDPRRVWLDVWAFEGLLAEAERADARGQCGEAIALAERALELYRGPFLGQRHPGGWAASAGERLHAGFLRSAAQLGRWLTAVDPERGRACYERALAVDDLAEELYQGLMACHQRLGRSSEGLVAYDRCRRALAAGLGVAPSAATEALRRALAEGGSAR